MADQQDDGATPRPRRLFGRRIPNTGASPVNREPPAAVNLEFNGRLGPLFRLVLKNALLTILTLGIYRFWAKTELRRYFWGHTVINGAPLEYTGRGLELFLGFLIVIAIIGPMTLAYDLALTALGIDSVSGGVLQLAYTLAVFCLIFAAVWRMWRYRLSRTTWRGIRFALTGKTTDYMWTAMGWSALTWATFGICYPWMRRRLWQMRIDHTLFGQTPLYFERSVKAGKLLGAWIIATLGPVAAGIIAMVIMISAEQATGGGIRGVLSGTVVVLIGTLVLAAIFGFTWYQIAEFRLFTGATRLTGGAALQSDARVGAVFVQILLYWFCSIAAVGAFAFMAAAFGMSDVLDGVLPDLSGIAVVPITAGFLVLVLVVLPSIKVLTLDYGLTKHFVSTMRITNPGALETTVQNAQQAPERGEGLADAFDVDAF